MVGYIVYSKSLSYLVELTTRLTNTVNKDNHNQRLIARGAWPTGGGVYRMVFMVIEEPYPKLIKTEDQIVEIYAYEKADWSELGEPQRIRDED